MKKIKDELINIFETNQFLKFGLYYRLFNLSRLADFLLPLIEIRTKKNLRSSSALLMALSRYQNTKTKKPPKPQKNLITNLTTTTNLNIITFTKNQNVLRQINKIYQEAQQNNSYFTLSQGINELTIITEETLMKKIRKLISDKEKSFIDDIASLGIHYDEKNFSMPGLLYQIIQPIALQGININEITSTYTEISVCVKQKDLKLLFNTIYNQFMV